MAVHLAYLCCCCYRGKKTKPDNDEDAQYDQAARELVFEAKAQAGDRTLTPEELADKEKQRLEALEKQRLKRMREAFDNADDDGDGGDVAGDGQGFAAKRRRQQKEQSGWFVKMDAYAVAPFALLCLFCSCSIRRNCEGLHLAVFSPV